MLAVPKQIDLSIEVGIGPKIPGERIRLSLGSLQAAKPLTYIFSIYFAKQAILSIITWAGRYCLVKDGRHILYDQGGIR